MDLQKKKICPSPQGSVMLWLLFTTTKKRPLIFFLEEFPAPLCCREDVNTVLKWTDN